MTSETDFEVADEIVRLIAPDVPLVDLNKGYWGPEAKPLVARAILTNGTWHVTTWGAGDLRKRTITCTSKAQAMETLLRWFNNRYRIDVSG